MSEEQIDLFQVKMQSNEPAPKELKAMPDSTVSYVKDSLDPRLQQIKEEDPLATLMHMSKEMELLILDMQLQIRKLKNNNDGTYADILSPKDSLGAEIPF